MTCFYSIIRHSQQCFLIFLLLPCLFIWQPVKAAKNGHFLTPPPGWSINPNDYEFNMNAVIRVNYAGTPSNAAGNLVGAFVGNELRGVAAPVIIGEMLISF